jgi:Holliday junction DNA helicase RuvA
VIRSLAGRLVAVDGEAVVVDVGGVAYELTAAPSLVARLEAEENGAEVRIPTYHYLQGAGQTLLPVLLGFANEVEREFFGRLLTVPGLGPKSAIRFFALSAPSLARAIELGDAKRLESIPGVGRAKARDIINKLKGKVADFVTEELPEAAAAEPEGSTEADALEVMTAHLGLPRADALARIHRAVAGHPEIDTVEGLIAQALREQG